MYTKPKLKTRFADPWPRELLLIALAGIFIWFLRDHESLTIIVAGVCLLLISSSAIYFNNMIAGPFRGMRTTLNKQESPKMFWTFTLLYFVIGSAMVLTGILQSIGLILR